MKIVYLLCATLLKCLLHHCLEDTINIFPHFVTPLNSIKELREMLHIYGKYGTFYEHTMQIGQSELLLKFIYTLSQTIPLEVILALGDLLSTCVQLLLLHEINPKFSPYIAMVIMFNPASMFGGGIQNVGAFNDAIFYGLLYVVYKRKTLTA
jgi:hypothetical protein